MNVKAHLRTRYRHVGKDEQVAHSVLTRSGFDQVVFIYTCRSEEIIKNKLGKSLHHCDGDIKASHFECDNKIKIVESRTIGAMFCLKW